MKVETTSIPDLLIIKPDIYGDERGYFFESYHKLKFGNLGINETFVQDSESRSKKGVVRGLHYQKPPFAQGKLIRVAQGAVIDVAVDIRKNSPTYGHWHAAHLSSENKHMFWIPAGFAHGFVSLEDDTIFLYKLTENYNKESEGSLLWNDPTLNIDWQIENPIINEKDQAAPTFKDFISPF